MLLSLTEEQAEIVSLALEELLRRRDSPEVNDTLAIIERHIMTRKADQAVERLVNDLAAANQRIEQAEAKLKYYEEPLPLEENGGFKDGRYTVTCDHRFTDQGLCIRCGEDAEEWDAGCVESMVNDLLDKEARIAELEAQLAAQWVPVEGLQIVHIDGLGEVEFTRKWIRHDDRDEHQIHYNQVPEGYAICRQAQAREAAE